MTYTEYTQAKLNRASIISQNRSRAMRSPPLPPLPVPEKPICPKVPVAYSLEGDYEGRLQDASECPPGCVVKWEDARS